MRRLLATALVTLLGASVVAFGFMHLAPIDPARFTAFRPGVRDEQINRLREWYALDRPFVVQYGLWMSRVLRGDFGLSVSTRREVGPELWRRLPWSLLLMGVGAILAWVMAVPLAIAGARGRASAAVASVLIGAGLLVPAFLLAALLVYGFAVRLVLIPILPPFEINLFDRALWIGLFLPSLSLAVPLAAGLAARMRDDLRVVLASPLLTAARAKGVPTGRLLRRHTVGVAARTLLARPLPAVSLLLSSLLIVEEIFNWPGIGRTFTRAIVQRDLPVMQGALFVFALLALVLEVAIRLAVGRVGAEDEAYAAAANRGDQTGRPRPVREDMRGVKIAASLALVLAVAAVAAPFVARFPPDQVLLEEINLGPSTRHWMGTDASGRDLFSRLMYGTRVSVGLAASGALLGTAAASLLALPPPETRWGRATRDVGALLGRIVQALPPLALGLVVVATAGRAPVTVALLFAALALGGGALASGRLLDRSRAWTFVIAARALGAPSGRVVERHMVSHLGVPLAATVAGLIPALLLVEATLGFLGFSVSPTTPSWGTLLWRAREALHRGDWWLVAFPSVLLGLSAWAFGTLASGLGRTHPPTYAPARRRGAARDWGAVVVAGARQPEGRRLRTIHPLPVAGGGNGESGRRVREPGRGKPGVP